MVQNIHTEIEIDGSPSQVRTVVRAQSNSSKNNTLEELANNTQKFLDFASMPEWHTGFAISRDATKPPTTSDVEAGEKINVNASGYKFTPTVLVSPGLALPFIPQGTDQVNSNDTMVTNPTLQENSPTGFRWLGSLPGIFSGEHVFKFEPSKTTPGGTTLTQSEEFAGLLSFLCGPTWSLGIGTRKQFVEFNESLKKRVEGS